MNKIWSWRLSISLVLIAASALTYGLHYLIFRDLRHIFLYLIGDIAFMFINVLVVTLVIEQIFARREKRALMKKLNMVIGTFFSDIGLELTKKFAVFVENADQLGRQLEFNAHWQKKDFAQAMEVAKNFSYKARVSPGTLRELRQILFQHRSFLIRLLENPNLLEHDRFTDLLWAVFHIMEELGMREESLEHLPEADYLHLAGDVKRAYSHIAIEWLAYAMHLKENYPFLFSLAARTNPFNQAPSAIVKE